MKKTKSKFLGTINKDVKRQQAETSGYGYLKLPRGVNIFKEEPGRLKLDIIPYEVTEPKHPDRDDETQTAVIGETWYKRPFKVHRNIGVNNETLICPRSIGKKCPICEYREKRIKEGAEREETDQLRASKRNLYVVIPIGTKAERKPHIWDISQFLFQNLLNAELLEDNDMGVFPDLEEGKTLKIRFDSQSLGKNKFAEASRIDFVDREAQYGEDYIKNVPKLDDVLNILPYEEIEALLLDLDPEDLDDAKHGKVPDVDDDEPEVPTRRKHNKVESEEKDETPQMVRRSSKVVKDEVEPDDDLAQPTVKRNLKVTSKVECPHGHIFGKDCDTFEDCGECEVWDACSDAQDEQK